MPSSRLALRARAASLKERFNRDFWLEDRGWFALGLDAHKRPIDALTSNIGHCLWTGIVDDDKVERVAAHLTSPEMFSGWGIRTLASSMTGYNPVSYHNGSVWPHDSTIVAAGLARTGRHDELRIVARGPRRRRAELLVPPARALRGPRSRRDAVPRALPDVVLAASVGCVVAAAPAALAPRARARPAARRRPRARHGLRSGSGGCGSAASRSAPAASRSRCATVPSIVDEVPEGVTVEAEHQ